MMRDKKSQLETEVKMITLSPENRSFLSKIAGIGSSLDTSEMVVFRKDSFFSNLAQLQSLAGQTNKALATIERISEKASAWSSMCQVAVEVAKNGEVDAGLHIAEKISEYSYRSDALSGIVNVVYLTDANRATQIASSIENPETRWETYLNLCIWECEAGRRQSAATMASGIKFPSYKARALLVVACSCRGIDDVEAVNKLIDTTHKTVEEIEDHLSRAEILRNLSDFHKSQNDRDRAIQTLRDGSVAASMIEDPEKNVDALLLCGAAQSMLGDVDGAAQTANDIAFASEYVDWSLSGAAYDLQRRKMEFLISSGGSLVAIKDFDFGTEDQFSRIMNLAAAVQILAKTGRKEDGLSLLAELLVDIEDLESNNAEMLSINLVSAALACGRLEDAIRVVEKIEDLTGSIDGPISGICSIAEYIHDTSGRLSAVEYLASAIKKIACLPAEDRVWSYECVSKTQKVIGDLEGAQESLRTLAALPHEDVGKITGNDPNLIKTVVGAALSTQDWTLAERQLALIEDIPDRIRLLVSILSGK